MKSTIVITGASGFVGSAIIKILLKSKHPVIAISRSKLTVPSGVKFIWTKDYINNISNCNDTTCIHLAGTRDRVEASKLGPSHDIESINITKTLLQKKFKRFIYTSTSAVYPTNMDRPCRPGDEINPSNNYALTKLACEKHVLKAGGVVARLSNIYGVGMATSSVISEILSQIPGKGPLTVNRASVSRDFIWIDDVAKGLVAMAEGHQTGVFNLGSGKSQTVGEIAKMALELAGESDRRVVSTNSEIKDSNITLDVKNTQKYFNWKAHVSMNWGLTELIQNKNR